MANGRNFRSCQAVACTPAGAAVHSWERNGTTRKEVENNPRPISKQLAFLRISTVWRLRRRDWPCPFRTGGGRARARGRGDRRNVTSHVWADRGVRSGGSHAALTVSATLPDSLLRAFVETRGAGCEVSASREMNNTMVRFFTRNSFSFETLVDVYGFFFSVNAWSNILDTSSYALCN